jgi:hypothetical protein
MTARDVSYHSKTVIRFMEKVKVSKTECWIWQGALDSGGYGRFMLDARRNGARKVELAHRVAWLLFKGKLPKWEAPDWIGLDHFKCDTPGCVNPDHLKLATVIANAKRGKRPYSDKVKCVRGHNLPSRKPGSRQRVCRECANQRNREWRANAAA